MYNRNLLLLLIVGFFFLNGCKNNSKTAETISEEVSRTVKLQMLVFANEGMLSNYEIALSHYQENHENISIELINIFGEDWSDFEHALRSRILSGKSPDIIDVSVIYRDTLIDEGILLDLAPYVNRAGLDMNLYFENQFEGLKRGDSLYGIPSGALLMAAYVNKDLFREAGVELPGLDWNNTWDWSEFALKTQQIRAWGENNGNQYGITMSFTIGWIIPFLLSNGSDFLTEDQDRCSALDPESRETFAFLKSLLFDKGISPDMMKLISIQPYQYFFEGNAGVFIDGNWWMESARNNLDFDWGIVPLPQNRKTGTGLYVDSWAIPSASQHPQEAFNVLQFFLEKEQQESGIMKGIPALKSSAYDIYNSRFDNLSHEEIDVWFSGISHGKTPFYFREWDEFQYETTKILQKYGFNELGEDEMLNQLCQSYLKARGE